MFRKSGISVIIPSYNHQEFIEEAIRSVQLQKYRPLELIVIDDGSKDGTTQILPNLMVEVKKSGILTKLIMRENKGAHATLNEGVNLATHQWITILNSDDFYLGQRLRKMMETAQKTKSEFIMSQVIHVDEGGKRLSDDHPMRDWYVAALKKSRPSIGFHLLYHNIGLTTGNFLFTKNLFKKIGGFRNFRLVHDYDFILRALFFTEPQLIKEELLAYRVHGKNTISENEILNASEGPKLASDWLRDLLFDGHLTIASAPWSQSNKQEFKSFWDGPTGSIRSWLGDVNLYQIFERKK